MKRVALAVLLALLSCAGAAAHGGDDHVHAEEERAPSSATSGPRFAVAQSEGLEAVLELRADDAADPHSLTLYLSDFATNEPIPGAVVALNVPDLDVVAQGVPVARLPGSYAFSFTPGREGRFAAILSVSGSRQDLLTFEGLRFGPDPDAAPAAWDARPWIWRALIVMIVALVVGIAWRLSSRRRRGRGASAAGLALVLLAAPLTVRAHGDAEHVHAEDDHAAHGAVDLEAFGVHGDPEHGAHELHGGPLSSVAIVTKPAQFAFDVRTIVASASQVATRLRLDGRVIAPPEARAQVVALQSGRVTAPSGTIPRIGDRVRKGQVLLLLDGAIDASSRLDAAQALSAARSRRSVAEAELSAAERESARLDAVPDLVSQSERDAAATRLATARAEAEAAARDVASLSAALGERSGSTAASLASPIDGVVTSADVTLGASVQEGHVFFTVVDPARLWIRADLPERDASLADSLAGSSAWVLARGASGDPVPARFVSATASIDPETRTRPAYFETDNAAGSLLEGMLVEVQAETSGTTTGFLVPATALTSISGRTLVFVHVHPLEFEPHDVVLGLRHGDQVEVLSGLHEGDRVVVSGTYHVRAALLEGSGR